MSRCLAIFALVVPALAARAGAGTIHVPGDYPTVQGAIDAAFDGDTVLVEVGYYVESLRIVDKDLVLESADGPDGTFLVGTGFDSVVTIDGGEVTVQGFSIVSGASQGGGGIWAASGSRVVIRGNVVSDNYAQYGGGISLGGEHALVEGNVIERNFAEFEGGGIWAQGFGHGAIRGNSIRDNEVPIDRRGGGVYSAAGGVLIEDNLVAGNRGFEGAGLAILGDLTVLRGNLVEENLDAFWGLGIYVEADGVQILGNTIRRNREFLYSGAYGGGIYALGADLLIADNEVYENRAEYIGGISSQGPNARIEGNVVRDNGTGGIFCHGSSVVRDCVVTGNTTAWWESGLWMSGGAGGLVEGCVIADNYADQGPAGVQFSGCTATIRSCLIAGNWRGYGGWGGGGIHVEGSTVEIEGCTVVANLVGLSEYRPGGGGILIADTALGCRVEGCIVWGNEAVDGVDPQIHDASPDLVVAHSDVEGGWPGPGNIARDPGFAAPDFVDVGAGDWSLRRRSPCVDAGVPGALPLAADLAGGSRVQDGDLDGVLRLDMGAFEYAHVGLTVLGDFGPGTTTTIRMQGPPGWLGVLLLSCDPGLFLASPFGVLFFDPATPHAYPFGAFALSASFEVAVPDGHVLPTPLLLQGIGWDPVRSTGNVTAPVVVDPIEATGAS